MIGIVDQCLLACASILSYHTSKVVSQARKEYAVDWNPDDRVGDHDHPAQCGGWRNIAVAHRRAHRKGKEEGVIESPCVRQLVFILSIVGHRPSTVLADPIQDLMLQTGILVGQLLH